MTGDLPLWLRDQRDAAAVDARRMAIEAANRLEAALLPSTGPWALRSIRGGATRITACTHLLQPAAPPSGIAQGFRPCYCPYPGLLVCNDCFASAVGKLAERKPTSCAMCGSKPPGYRMVVTNYLHVVHIGTLCLACHGAELRAAEASSG